MSNLSLVVSREAAERAPRKSLLKAAKLDYNGTERRGIVRNISDTGAMIETDLHLRVGDTLAIELPAHGKRTGIVRWVNGVRAGIEFTQAMTLGQDADPRLTKLNLEAKPSIAS